MENTQVDVNVENHGSIFIFQPLTELATAWIEDNVGGETTWFGGGLVVEHRYAFDLAEGMQGDGLVLE